MIIEVNSLGISSKVSCQASAGEEASGSDKFKPYEQFQLEQEKKSLEEKEKEIIEAREDSEKYQESVKKLLDSDDKIKDKCLSIMQIRDMDDDLAFADGCLKFMEINSGRGKKDSVGLTKILSEFDKLLKNRCDRKADCIVSDLKKVLNNPMIHCESLKRLSETLDYRRICEVIAPPGARERIKYFKSKPLSRSDTNDKEYGSPAKWNGSKLISNFEKVFSIDGKIKEEHMFFLISHMDDMLRLLKLEEYPFAWRYAGRPHRPEAASAFTEFELFAQVLYDRFVGKPSR